MSRSQAVIVGGGIAASPAFTATDESEGRGVIITNEDPASVGAANFGMDATGQVWIVGAVTAAQRATNLQRAVILGRSIANVATWGASLGTNAPVIIGFQAGVNVTGGTVLSDCVVIGNGAIGDADSVCIGAGVTCNCNNGASDPTLINSRGVTGDLLSGIYIGTTSGGVVGATTGIFLNGQCDQASGGGSTIIGGRTEGGAGIAIGGGGTARITGGSIAIGANSFAGGPLFGTLYDDAIALGEGAQATGTGAAGNRRSIAIGLSAVATCDNATANAIAIGTSASATASGATGASLALGPSATAATGQCVVGATGFPMEFRVIAAAAGERLRVDATAVAGNTALMIYDVDNNTLERVTVGAADSGGVGFKLLRIPN